MQPSNVERVIRRATLMSTSTDSVPMAAAANRQPKGVTPKRCSPAAMSHLPIGGCATKPGPTPAASRSTPWCSRSAASLA